MPSTDADSSNGRSTPARNGALSPLPSVSLSREHITEALAKSPDNGATLDLAHKSLTDVGEDGAEELATVGRESDAESDSTLVRIALAHNRLTTLPMAFALLSHLRYLVLKANNFTVFPDVLTVMPSLEILDISRNKIKRLPSQPGSLTNLRVFSISRNKIHRLPIYFAQFKNLNLFRADLNPMEWPPKLVMEPPGGSDESQVMKDWIKGVQKWIEINTANGLDRKLSEDSVQDVDADSFVDESGGSSHLDSRSIADASLHSRSFSLESNMSIYTDMANLHSKVDPGPSRSAAPSRLRLDVLPPSSRVGSAFSSPLRSPTSYLPTPDEPIPSTDDDSTITRRGHDPLHSRNASSGPSRSGSRHREFAKKSLPDLRQTITTDIHSGPTDTQHSHGIPSPPHRQESDSSNGSLASLHRSRVLTHDTISTSPASVDRPPPPMDVERNSYFRRLSTLSPATISKTIPASILTLVDAIRGILFAVSQIYQTLQHYTVYAIDERLSAVLMKVLDPACLYMHQLINALDRFDAASRRQLPSPAICRAVVESCRDTVTVFGKAVGVLSLQLKILATHDDVRYTRQMLLVLYGAMAEIASAWQAIAGQLEAVRPLLLDHRPPPVKAYTATAVTIRPTAHSAIDKATPPPIPASAPPVPSVPFGYTQGQIGPLLRSNSGHGGNGGRISRRHAGSFSLKDVEIGKMLPSYIEAPHYSAGVVDGSATPTLRAARRPGTTPSSAKTNGFSHQAGGPPALSPVPPLRWDTHSRQGSYSSLLPSSSSSPSLGLKKPSIDLAASKSNTLVDKEAIGAMKVAVDSAPPVWEMMDEILMNEPETKEQLSGVLERAKGLTAKLKVNISVLESGDTTADRGSFREDAHGFAKIVIQLSSALKTHGIAHPLSSALRTNMVKLTNATQEFVILLHVSSFSSSTPRPYSPMVNGVSTPSLASPAITDDGRLGANLSRSRSAVPSSVAKLVRPPSREPPRSALPQNPTFKIPMPPRFGLLRSRSGEDYSVVPS